MTQEMLIYIDEKEKYDASAIANSYTDKDTKNRAYVNTLGAELALKYLESENVQVSGLKNIHSIKNILEMVDISDIILPDLHIDVRVVFDEDAIFVPKSHFEYNLAPDVYLVLLLAKDFSNAQILGFFEPKLINKNNQNDNYYFIEKEKLTPITELVNYMAQNGSKKEETLSDDEIENCKNIIISMLDHDVSENDKIHLFGQLKRSTYLRDLYSEFENFETLSFKVINDNLMPEKEQIPNIIQDEIEAFDSSDAGELPIDEVESDSSDLDNIESINVLEDTSDNDISDLAGIADVVTDNLAGNIIEGIEGISEAENLLDASVGLSDAEEDLADNTEAVDTDEKEQYSASESDILETNDATIPQDQLEDIEIENLDLENVDGINEEESNAEESEEELSEEETITKSIEPNEDDLLHEDLSEVNVLEENISLDNVSIDDISAEPLQEEDEATLSVDDVDVSKLEAIESETDIEDNLSLEDVEIPELQENIEENVDEIIDINGVEEIATEDLPELDDTETISLDNTEALEEVSTEEIEDASETISLDSVEIPDELSERNEDSESVVEEISLDNIAENEIPEANTEEPKEYSEAFGKNLLENLSAEDLENVSAENSESSNDEAFETISSDDLLSQIDDILSTSSQVSDNEGSGDNILPPTDYLEDILDGDHEEKSENPDNLNVLFNENSQTPEPEFEDIENLNMLTSEPSESVEDTEPSEFEENTEPADDLDTLPEASGDEQKPADENKNKNNIKMIAVAAVLAVVIGIGTAFTLLKPKDDGIANIQPIPNNAPEEVADAPQAPEKSEGAALQTSVPEAPKTEEKSTTVVQETNTNKKTPIAQGEYLTVNKIVWDVPDNLSYSANFQNYLRTAGKSIKLSLTADLLLAEEYAYTNQVKVALKLSKDGNIQESRIISSSGSEQIDNIVLQSVKDTLSVIKPPSSDVKDPDFNLNLIIYF